MAARAAIARRAAQVVVVRSGTGRRIARAAGRAAVRGAGRAAAWAAREEKHTLYALGTAAGLGLATRFRWNLPKIPGTSAALTVGIVAWGVGRLTKNESARHVATGALSIGLYDLIAYSKRTRDSIEDLVDVQRDEEEAEEEAEDDEDNARGRASSTTGVLGG